MFESKEKEFGIKLPFGLRDIFPIETEERNKIKNLIADEFKYWGYGEVKTPVIEYTKNISVGAGIKWKDRLINFFDIDGSLVSLRADMTIPIARLTGMRVKKEQLPVRFCYFANSFRQSEIQKGIKREYNQAGLEFIGSKNEVMADIEVIIILINTLLKLGLNNTKIVLGNIRLVDGLCEWMRLNTKGKKIVKQSLVGKNLVELEDYLKGIDKNKTEIFMRFMRPENNFKTISDLANKIENEKVKSGTDYLINIKDKISELGFEDFLLTDFSIIREFDYYTGLLFEIYSPEVTGILGSGGRYDGLIKKFGLDVPATGFALDIDSVHMAAGINDNSQILKILLVIPENGNNFKEIFKIANELRKEKIIVEMIYESCSDIIRLADNKKCNFITKLNNNLQTVEILDLKNYKKEEITVKEFLNIEKWKEKN